MVNLYAVIMKLTDLKFDMFSIHIKASEKYAWL